jgi:hypothetical protein
LWAEVHAIGTQPDEADIRTAFTGRTATRLEQIGQTTWRGFSEWKAADSRLHFVDAPQIVYGIVTKSISFDVDKSMVGALPNPHIGEGKMLILW